MVNMQHVVALCLYKMAVSQETSFASYMSVIATRSVQMQIQCTPSQLAPYLNSYCPFINANAVLLSKDIVTESGERLSDS